MERPPSTPNVPLERVPQLKPRTGLSDDYVNTFAFLVSYYSAGEAALLEQIAQVQGEQGKLLQRYDEYFSPEKYVDVITDQNREAVQKINEIVDRVNALAAAGTLGATEAMESFRQIDTLIKGQRPQW